MVPPRLPSESGGSPLSGLSLRVVESSIPRLWGWKNKTSAHARTVAEPKVKPPSEVGRSKSTMPKTCMTLALIKLLQWQVPTKMFSPVHPFAGQGLGDE